MKDGRRKGQEYMNAMCRAMSLWLFPDMDPKTPVYDLPFRTRSTCIMPVEGHWRGEGDLLTKPDIDFRLCIEAKKHEGWTLDGLFREKSPIWKWWEQAELQAAKLPAHPLLLFSRNRQKTFALLHSATARHLEIVSKHGPVLRITKQADEYPGLTKELFLCLLDDLVSTNPKHAETLP
jgi:hypothetical protein